MKITRIHSRVCITLMFCILCVAGTRFSFAQEKDTSYCRSAIYIEGFGQGILYSINYDYRFTPNIGLRTGFTSWSMPFALFAIDELKFTGFPIMVNYLSGQGTSHLELGIGVVPAIISFQGRMIFFGGEVSGETITVLGTATIGYRAQSRDGGFVFRIGLTPLFTLKGSQISGGLSLGFAF